MLKDTVKKRLGYMVKNEREHLRLKCYNKVVTEVANKI